MGIAHNFPQLPSSRRRPGQGLERVRLVDSLAPAFAGVTELNDKTLCVLQSLVRVFAVLFLFVLPAQAVQPDEILKDPTLEARARSISEGLRCLVCQNQSIDDSDATVAKDLRILIREQLQQNKTDDQVVDFVVQRYGEYVLLKPVFRTGTLALWTAPFLILLLALLFAFRRNGAARPDTLTAEEKAEVAAILKK
jgi:cytochrome c-type biogenesis protein CcmH